MEINETLQAFETYLNQFEWLENGGLQSFQAVLVFIVIFFGLKIFKNIIVSRIKAFSERTTTKIDDHLAEVLENISSFFYFFVSLYGASKFLTLPELGIQILDTLLIIVTVGEVVKVTLKLTDLVFTKTVRRRSDAALQGLKLLIKIVLWVTALLLILSNLGINISALMASLGIGGIAIALAAQNIFSDLFASFSIFFDRPFEIGDFVILGTDKGTVEKVGLKSTRIRTLQGEELVVSNQELTSARVQNFKKMQKRRVTFTLGVEYGTPNTKLEKIVPAVKAIIDKQEKAEFDRGHFMAFADCSLNFDFVYYVDSGDYAEYCDIHQAVNFEIKKAFEKIDVSMAFPTRTVHLVK